MVKHMGNIESDDVVNSLRQGVRQLPKGELLVLIRQVEDAVHRGTAQMRDYETFVYCQEELARRELLYK